MTNDTVHSYTYGAEGNVTKVDGGSTAQYVYDAFNRRVHVQVGSTATEYTYDYAGRRISSWLSPNNSGIEGRIYWDGQQFGYRSQDGTTYFDHQDTLGTERIRTNYGGTVGSTYRSLPWGDGYTATVNNAGADQDNNHFAGLERDAESGTEHAQFRNYASTQGRWLAPDSYMGSYDLSNPQSMNRYAYVLNNPLSLVDPTGLDCGDSNGTDIGDVGGTGIEVGGGCNPPDPAPSQPGNWCGGASWGTQGCIQWPCWMISACASQPSGPGPSGGGGSSGAATAASPGSSSAPSNGRNCSAAPASVGQYVAATVEAALLTGEFASGLGAGNQTFGPNTATSQVLGQSAGVQEVLGAYLITGQSSGLYTFGASGAYVAGGNPAAQFVGSFRYSISGGVLTVTNTTSVRSLTYDQGPQYQRGSFPTPGGNVHQTFQIGLVCH